MTRLPFSVSDRATAIARALRGAIAPIAQTLRRAPCVSAALSQLFPLQPPFLSSLVSIQPHEPVLFSWDPAKHPRGEGGRFTTPQQMPRLVSAVTADKILQTGAVVRDTTGQTITFGKRLADYLDGKPDGAARKRFIQAAIKTVRTDKDPLLEGDRITYRQVFMDKDGRKRAMRVMVDRKTGEVFNMFPDRTLARRREAPNRR